MSAGFKSGTRAITTGELDITITGLALGFTPASVVVYVRQPSTTAEIISAYLVGTPSADGFSVTLSSPATVSGYYLDWTAFSEGTSPSPVAGDTLAADYATLKKEVARFLGYNLSALTTAQADEIDLYIQSGIRNFYYPPQMEGVEAGYEWSFLRQNGSVALEAGVTNYMLSDGFGRVAGQLVYSDAEARRSVPVIPYGDIKEMLSREPDIRARPRFAAVMSASEYGTRGQRKRIYFFPTPDKIYTLNFVCDADTGKIDATNRPFPLGGVMFAELVIESCLAVAEQKANDEKGLHTQNFNELLVSMIQRDRKSGAKSYGKVGDPNFRVGAFRGIYK